MSTPIETGVGGAEAPQIAIDANGNALAVWHQFDGTNYSIWVNRYTASTNSWGTAGIIETGVGIALFPEIAFDANGNALAVWGQSDGAFRRIFANRYTASSNSWGTAVAIQIANVAANIAFGPKIAFDSSGNALAVWQQFDGTVYSIFANRYTANRNSWGTAGVIETGVGNAFFPEIAVDASGNALAMWSQFDGTVNSIFANRYTASSNSWGTAGVIETGVGNAVDPQIDFDASGNALAVWQQFDGTVYSLFASRYTASSNSWGTAVAIEINNIVNNIASLSQQIAIDANGNALAVWHQFDGTAYSIWVNRYTASSDSWGTASVIEISVDNAFAPQVAFDASGNALAVWYQLDGTVYSIWANRFVAGAGMGSGWGMAAVIETDDAGNAFTPQIAFDASGNALAVWEQDGDASAARRGDIWANRFE